MLGCDNLPGNGRVLLVTEPFSQWVIEDDFAGPRPSWERAGGLMTDDVALYERIKLRRLNGSPRSTMDGSEKLSQRLLGTIRDRRRHRRRRGRCSWPATSPS